MEDGRAGTVDVTAVISLLAALAACAAVAAAALLYWQVRESAAQRQLGVGLESLWHLDDRWNSGSMADIRSAAAGSLLAGKPSAEVGDVLGFFAQVGRLVDEGAVDEPLAALEFYWPLANYWLASRDYVTQVRGDDPAAWREVGDLMNRLAAVEARRRKGAVADVRPSPAQVQQFLTDEQQSDECSDDSDVQKTPL